MAQAWIATLAPEASEVSGPPCAAGGSGLHWQDPDGGERWLTEGFVTACDPILDFAGEDLFFAGRRAEGEELRIWRLNLPTNELTPATPVEYPARNPSLLPDGSILFISRGDLFRLRPEDSQPEQLTFSRGLLRSAAVLPDGRILFLAGEPRVGQLFSMLPDGTWTTLWPGFEDLSVQDFAIVDSHRLLVLGEADHLFLAEIADPFAGRRPIAFDSWASLRSLHPVHGRGAVLLADAGGKTGATAPRALALGLDPEPRLTELELFDHGALLALASAGPAPRVDPLPTIVKPERDTGYLFVIDVARTDDPSLTALEREEIVEMRILRLEESGSRSLLAQVEPAADGSVYMEAPADTPLAFELVNRQGRVLAGTRTPIWVRPNERRGCLGCHVSPAYAPPNVLPRALLQGPLRVAAGPGVSP